MILVFKNNDSIYNNSTLFLKAYSSKSEIKEEFFDLKKQFDTFDTSLAQMRFEETKYEANYLRKN
jgi:hypothetical protein